MSWKKYGGIYNLENNNNVNVYSLVAEYFTLRQSYFGTFDISGELHVSGNASIDTSLKANNLTIVNDISTNRLFVKNETYHYNDVDVSGNMTIRSGDLIVLTNLIVNGSFQLENKLYLGNSKNAYLFGTDVIGNIGINTITPIASFDISSSYPIAFNVGSAVQEQIYSIPVQNKNNRGIVLAANTNASQIAFYNDASINAIANISDGTITYSRGGVMTVDVSDNTNILSKLSVSYRANNVVSHVMGETAVIYDISAGQYLKPIYENATETTGNALSLIANDASSITFMNMITPNKQGISIGGGVYPNDQTRSMGSIGWRDPSANYTPSINLVSGKSNIRNKTTIGINTQSPSTDAYTFDMNGPVHLKNGELTITAQPTMEIRALGVGKTASKNAVAVGSSYKTIYDAFSTRYYYKQQILYTNNGGENWKYNYDLSGDSIENLNQLNTNLNAVYVYDASVTIIGGDNAYAYYTYSGYEKTYNNRTWQTIISPYSQSANSRNYSIKSIYVNSSKRAFFGIDVSGSNSIIYAFNILDLSSGITTSNASDSSVNIPTAGKIKSIDGYGNNIWVVAGNLIYSVVTNNNNISINNNNQPIKSSESYIYNSISVFDASNLIIAGNNIISFTTDGGSNWTDISLNIPIVNNIRIIDSSNAIAVCNSGIILKSLNWKTAGSWVRVSTDELNVSGNATRLNDPTYNLTNVGIVDINNFYITKTIQSYTTNTIGNTSLFHSYLPNVFNTVNNFVFDISGSMRLSGDMNVNEGGKIASNNQTFNLLNNGVNQINFGGDASNVYIGNAKSSTVFVNSNLNVNADAYFNSNVAVNTILKTNTIECCGNIQYTSDTSILPRPNINDILIGGFNITNVSSRDIKIGNFNPTSSTNTNNYISIGGPKDFLSIYGNLTVVSNMKSGPIFYLNYPKDVFGNLLTIIPDSVGAGLNIGDKFGNDSAGYFKINNAKSGYLLKATENPNSINIDVSNLVIPNSQYTGIVSIYRRGFDASYNIATCAIDPSNIILGYTPYPQQIYADLTITGFTNMSNVSISGDLGVTGKTTINGTLNVTGTTSLSSLIVNNNENVIGTLTVTGTTFLSNVSVNYNASITGNAVVKGTLKVTGNTTLSNIFVNNNANITGDEIIGGTLTVTGDTSLQSNLGVSNNQMIGGTLTVTGTTYLSNMNASANANISGDSNIGGKLYVTGNTILSNLVVNANEFIAGSLRVNGATVLNNNTNVVGTLNVTGAITIDGPLTVTGATSIGSTLSVTGATAIGSTLSVTGATSIGSTLSVTGATAIRSTLSVTSETVLGSSLSVTGALGVTGTTVLGSTLSVNGATVLGTTLSVTGATAIRSTLSVTSETVLGSSLSVTGALGVTGTTVLGSTLSVNGATSIGQTLSVTGATAIRSTLSVTSETVLGSTLSVTGALGVTGTTVLGSTLSVNGTTVLGSTLSVTGATAIRSTLSVTSATVLGSTLSVTGALGVTGTTVLGSTLSVTGESSLTDLKVLGNLICSNVYINRCNNLSGTETLNYPLYNTYNVTSGSDTTIYLPAIEKPGVIINFFKSGSKSILLTIRSAFNINSFVANGDITQLDYFTIPSGTTSATLVSSIGYWTGIGGGGSGGAVSGNLNVGGEMSVTGTTNLKSSVLIGTGSTATGYILTVTGGVQASSYNATSDRRLKSNIQILPNQITSILAIEPVTFNWKVDGKQDVGFIAQNVYRTYPELIPNHLKDSSLDFEEPVDPSGNPIYYAMDYGKMTPFLWQGMREIIQRLEILESENRDLKSRIEIIESK